MAKRTARSIEPFFSLELDAQWHDKFLVQELTFNPVLDDRNGKWTGREDVWVEIVLTCGSDYECDTCDLPEILVQLRDFESTSRQPQCTLYESDERPTIDINKVFYSEIWASFIPSHDARGDFMVTGYKSASRLIAQNVNFSGLSAEFERHRVPGSLDPIDLALSDLSSRFELLEHFFAINPIVPDSKKVSLPSGLAYRGSKIDVSYEAPVGGLTFKRIPWGAPSSADPSNVIPCSCKISPSGLKWRIRPDVIQNDSKTAIELKAGDSIAFWIWFPNVACSTNAEFGSTLNFQIDIRSEVPVSNFNTFFRVPRSIIFHEGSLTDLKRYAVPPKLFTPWDGYLNSDCYSHHLSDINEGNLISVSADFNYAREQIEKLTTVFILGLVASLLSAFSINVLTSAYTVTIEDAEHYFNIPGTDHIIGVLWMMASGLASVLSIAFVIRLVYISRSVRWRFGLAISLLIFFAPIIVSILLDQFS